MYVSLFHLVFGAGCGIRLYRFLIIAFLSTFHTKCGRRVSRERMANTANMKTVQISVFFCVYQIKLIFTANSTSFVLGRRFTKMSESQNYVKMSTVI